MKYADESELPDVDSLHEDVFAKREVITMSEERKLTFMGAINEAIDQSMEQDDNVILIGTDVSGGAGVEHIKDDDTFGGVLV